LSHNARRDPPTCHDAREARSARGDPTRQSGQYSGNIPVPAEKMGQEISDRGRCIPELHLVDLRCRKTIPLSAIDLSIADSI
jgi:hypothetical protein